MWTRSRRNLIPLQDRGPLRVQFLLTSMPVGGAETLLVNLIRRMSRERFAPEVCCLKEPGPLGDEIAFEIPVHSHLIGGKFDVGVLPRLTKLMRESRVDAAITVGCGDKMFWGRLAAWYAGVPVVASAIHSTGWPDGVGPINRRLTPITDAFIACARDHGRHLVTGEKFPEEKVFVIPNGIDTDRFHPAAAPEQQQQLRQSLKLPVDVPLVCIVAALRPEKNHRRFLRVCQQVQSALPAAQFVIVGDGDERPGLESLASELGLTDSVHFLGSRGDIPEILRACDAFALTSDNEAAPVSIMEAMASGLAVVASNVGSIHEMIIDGETGYLADLSDECYADRLIQVLSDRDQYEAIISAARSHVVEHASLDMMVRGYEDLITSIYQSKSGVAAPIRADEREPVAV